MSDKREYFVCDVGSANDAINNIVALDLKKKWRITIEPYRKNRTTNQNRLMWRWNEIIAKHTGHTPEEIHEHCKGMFLTPKQIVVNGRTTEYRTTTDLKTDGMSEYLERIRAWAATDLNITLSDWGER